MSTASLTTPLPDAVEEKSEELGLKPKHQCKSLKKNYLGSFLHRRLPASSFKKGIQDELKHKVFVFDNVKKKMKNHPRSKKKPLTSREKRDMKLFDIKPDDQKYALYLPLHELWKDYMRELIDFTKVKDSNMGEMERKLLKADLHGGILVVAKSRCPSLVGAQGILVQETKNTMRIVTEDDKMKTIPKRNSVFSITVEGYNFTIYGNNFMFRASERASRNFKAKYSIDL